MSPFSCLLPGSPIDPGARGFTTLFGSGWPKINPNQLQRARGQPKAGQEVLLT